MKSVEEIEREYFGRLVAAVPELMNALLPQIEATSVEDVLARLTPQGRMTFENDMRLTRTDRSIERARAAGSSATAYERIAAWVAKNPPAPLSELNALCRARPSGFTLEIDVQLLTHSMEEVLDQLEPDLREKYIRYAQKQDYAESIASLRDEGRDERPALARAAWVAKHPGPPRPPVKSGEAPSHGFRMKHLLADMARQDPARFLATFAPTHDGVAYLRDLWSGIGIDLPEAERVDADGVAIEDHGGLRVIRLPSPRRRGDPAALAVAGDERALRVFFCEKGESPPAWLTEVTSGTRSNLGPLPGLELEGFVDGVRRVIG